MSALHLVGGEKGGVGKSVLSRLLCQLLIDQGREFVAFDGDGSHPALLRYYAGYSRPVDIHRFESCDGILLAALRGAPVVVDLPAQSDAPIGRWLDESGVSALAAEAGLRVVRWQVMDDGKDSLRLLAPLLTQRAPAVDFLVVRNHGCGRDFGWMEGSPELEAARAAGAVFVDLPGLHAPTMSKIDRIDASFWAACHNGEQTGGLCLNLVERNRVQIWLQRAQAALTAAHPSLRVLTSAQHALRPAVAQAAGDQRDTQAGAQEPSHSFNPISVN